MTRFLRLTRAEDEAADSGPLVFTASMPGTKRDGYDTAALPWSVDNYRSNPVVTWVHDFQGQRLPIGRGEVEVMGGARGKGGDGERMRVAITFDPDDEFAQQVERKYRAGFLHAVSVSWDDVDADGVPIRAGGGDAVAHDLLEIAAVPVPGDPDALLERQAAALRALSRDIDAALADDEPELRESTVSGGEGTTSGVIASRAIPGTYEELSEHLARALQRADIFAGARHVWVVGTYAERAIACVWYGSGIEDGERVYDVPYSRSGDSFEFGEPTRVELEYTTEVRPYSDGRAEVVTYAVVGDRKFLVTGKADTQPDETDELTTERAWGAMLQAMDRTADLDDSERRRLYNRAEAAYRRLGMVAPEWLEGDELRALDDETWRGLWLEGEVIGRAGAKLARRNMQRLDRAIDALMEIRADALDEDMPETTDDSERNTDAEAAAMLRRLLADLGA